MSSMPICIRKKMRYGCDKLLMRGSILIVKNIRLLFKGCYRKKSLKSCIKSRDT